MPATSYPFIDIAVHERVRDHFARGDAAILFAPDLSQVLWSNGEGAALFGLASIYDFLDGGPTAANVAFRQMQATARQLRAVGETRRFLMRIPSGFQNVAVPASLELIDVRAGEKAILFAAPRAGRSLPPAEAAARMISGFDDPDTHMAVLDGAGQVIAASPQFAALGMTERTLLALVTAVGTDSDWLLKRPVPTGKGTLPAAIGKLSSDPALHLLFAVETVLGHMDATDEFEGPIPAPDLPPVTPADAPEVEDDHSAAQGMDAAADVAAEAVAEPVAEESPAEAATDALAPEDDIAETEAPGPVAEAPADHFDADAAPEDVFVDAPEEPAAIADDLPAAAHAPVNFVFDPAMRAIRFVWKIGSDGRFSEISKEFALAVGPRAADVVGQSFADLADRFALDPDRAIIDLLNRRDTWSGKTVLWPVEGEALCVPVDLAALPTYSRDRAFDGFRGFGIVRVTDIVADPDGRGLTLGDPAARADSAAEAPQALPEPAPAADGAETTARETLEDEGDFLLAPQPDEGEPDAPADEPDAAEPDAADLPAEPSDGSHATEGDDVADDGLPYDPFMGERPALKLVETPARRMSDAIVQIEDARPAPTETLSRSEQAAFREIARQLTTTFGKREAPPAVPPAAVDDADADAAEAVAGSGEPTAADAAPDAAPATEPDDDGATATEAAFAEADTDRTVPDDILVEDGQAAEIAADETVAEIAPSSDTGSTDDAGVAPEPDDALLTPAMVDRLAVAMLIHSGDDLYHANPEFLALTGYQTLQDLRVEGGIDALFVGDDEGILDVPPGAMMMIRNDGRLLPVTARLQSVRFEDKGAALMMSLAVVPASAPAPDETVPPQAAMAEPAPLPPVTAEGFLSVSLAEAQAQVESLRIETEELHSILETATDGVVVIGADGDIRSLNRSANALFNYNGEDVVGKPFATLFAHESQRAVLDYLAGLSGHGVASVLNDGREVIGREASGGFIPLFMTMGRLSSSNGYCAVIRDITQWKRTEEELRSAKRAAETANAHKTDFLARVSHEIRTPLNAIIGFSDMMASEHFGPIGNARYIEYASDIGRSGRHVLDIVNDLLDISKIEAGEMELEFSAVEINDAVSEAVSLVQPQANAQRVIIRTSLSTSVPSVVADNRSIKQIALNILANAIRFTPSGGQIVVSTGYEANGSVMLRIRDTGVGMTRTELEQAMKPFRQVTTGVRKRGEGTGLGLPLTKAMAEANRALFSINSAPNEGTLVEITFPSQRVLAN